MLNRNMTVGIFAVAGIALFTLGIFLIGNQQKAFTRHIEIYTEFSNLDGLMKGSKVRVAGMDAGQVDDITIPEHASAKFRLKLSIDQRLHAVVRTDSLVTIATQGVVGDTFVLVHQGSAQAAEAASLTTLRSKEPVDLADLFEKSSGMLKSANGSVKEVGGKLNEALDAITRTVNNANDVVIGLKQGRGPAGVLLRDEATAENLRQTVENARQATATLSHTSSQADELVSDLRSRQLPQKADEVMASAKSAAQNIDRTSQQLRQSLTEALGPDDQGVETAANIRQSISNLNQATGNMAEDTEAIKHNFFFRGFFKHRGYYTLAGLAPDRYRQDKVFTNPLNHREWIAEEDLFQAGSDGLETLSTAGKRRINMVVAQWGDSIVGHPIIVEGYSTAQDGGEQMAVSRDRAILVRQYLHTHFNLDLKDIGAVALSDRLPPRMSKTTWDGICIVILKSEDHH